MLLLMELLKDWPCTISGGDYATPVYGITENASQVKEGFIFIVRKGGREDGFQHVDEAIRRGASALIVDRLFIHQSKVTIPIVVVPDCKTFLSHACAHFTGNPSKRLVVVAITGTNGKTTVAHFVGQLLTANGVRTAVIGTTGLFIDGRKVEHDMPSMTTPSAEHLHHLLRKCEEEGLTHIILEASSLGLEMNRLDHCEIDVGVLLNIGTDHYDEHGSKEAYITAKKKLFQLANQMIVNEDDPTCLQIVEGSKGPVSYFGMNRGELTQEQIVEVEHRLPGQHNLKNIYAALAVMKALGYSTNQVTNQLRVLSLPEGRLERVENDGVIVYVDYAHTPDALRVVLETLCARCYGKLITVFGCGGDRDKGKRREMGEVAVYYSTSVIVTSDNPRSEDPYKIIEDIMAGFGGECSSVESIVDRKTAIRKAVFSAAPGDIVLVAGKGHEITQHTSEGIFSFSDIGEVKQALAEKIVRISNEMDSE